MSKMHEVFSMVLH